MIVSLKIDNTEFKEAILEFIRYQRVSVAIGLRIQAAHLAERLIKFTPPKTESQGKKAVARDIRRVYGPLNWRKFRDPMRGIIKGKNYDTLRTVIASKKEGPLVGKQVIKFDPSLHRRLQDRRGRINREWGNVTPDNEEVKEYIKQIQTNVGQAKGGWAESVIQLSRKVTTGISVPGWIEKHKRSGSIVDDAENVANASITMLNNSKWAGAGDQDRVVAGAIRARVRDIRKFLKLSQEEALKKAGLK